MKYVEKITPDFPSKSTKFLSTESCVYTLAFGISCGKWSPCYRGEGENLVWGWGGAGDKAEGSGGWLEARMQLSVYEVEPRGRSTGMQLCSPSLLPQAPILKVAKYLGKQSSRSNGWR